MWVKPNGKFVKPPSDPCVNGNRVYYHFHDRSGNNLVREVRLPNKKMFLESYDPKTKRWRAGLAENFPRENIPIYKFKEVREAIQASRPVILVEGAKCADFLWNLGFAATAVIGGASNYRNFGKYRMDLQDATVIISPDMDQKGLPFLNEALVDFPAAIVLRPFPDSHFWDNLPKDHGLDIEDELRWHLNSGLAEDDIKELLHQRICEAIEDSKTGNDSLLIKEVIESSVQRLEPEFMFPVELGRMLRGAADSFPVAHEYLSFPLLSITAGLIGKKACVRMKGTWKAPLIIWTGLVARAGTKKSPALHTIMRPIFHWQALAKKEYDEKFADYEKEREIYDSLSIQERRQSKRPKPPVMKDYYLDRFTIEALAETHVKNPNGFFVYKDELSGILSQMGQYKGGKGDDKEILLGLQSGGPLKTNNKSSQHYIEATRISLTGNFTDDNLRRLMKDANDADGFWGRFLFAMPARRPAFWTDVSVDISGYLARIYQYLMNRIPEGTELAPSAKALELYKVFIEWAEYQIPSLDTALAIALSKIEGYVASLCGLYHLIDHACLGTELTTEIGADTMWRAIYTGLYSFGQIKAFRWSCNKRFDPTQGAGSELEKIAQLALRKGGSVTAREVLTAKIVPDAATAKKKMQELAKVSGVLETKGKSLIWKANEDVKVVADKVGTFAEFVKQNYPHIALPTIKAQVYQPLAKDDLVDFWNGERWMSEHRVAAGSPLMVENLNNASAGAFPAIDSFVRPAGSYQGYTVGTDYDVPYPPELEPEVAEELCSEIKEVPWQQRVRIVKFIRPPGSPITYSIVDIAGQRWPHPLGVHHLASVKPVLVEDVTYDISTA